MNRKLLAPLLGLLAFASSAFAQCFVQLEAVTRQSADDLNILVQGTSSHDCQQITVHWTNPPLPDKTFAANVNNNDPTVPNTWSVPYSSTDGLTLSMLVNNFPCGSTNFSVQATCANVPNCQANAPATVGVACKRGDAVCAIQDIDLHCDTNGRLTAETSVSSTGSESVSVTLTVTRDGQNVASRTLSDTDGFVIVTSDFDFAAGNYTVTTSVTAPPSCVQNRTATFTIDQPCPGNPPPAASPTPTSTAGGNATPTPTPNAPPPTPCPTCSICGGDFTCCIAWALVFIALLVLVATILYLICDPSGGGGWGWLILAIAAIVFALALWWIVVHCQFNLCALLQMLAAAFTIDLTLVCAVEGLIPCFSALICGVTVIAGVAIRNWFIILVIGILVMLGIQVFCPL